MGGLTLAIDFDSVIHDRQNPVEGRRMGPPMIGAIEALQDLYPLNTIIIHTTMANTPSGRKAVADWLEYYDIDYHAIVGKPKADIYLDDRGVTFKNWRQARKDLQLDT